MKERIVEILMYIMSEMQSRKSIMDIDVGDLRNQGYTQAEISAAFSWLYDNLNVHERGVIHEAAPSKSSKRVFHDVEKQMLSVESQGYLIQLCELGVLDEHDLEVVIEKVMMSGFEKLTPAELQDVVSSVLLTKNSSATDANRSALYNRNTIH